MMSFLKFVICIVLGFALLACSDSEPGKPDGQMVSDVNETDWREQHYQYGREIYESSCARCHDQGASAAPFIGDRESWSNRSPLWCAVLFEHAKNGYLTMPPRGGNSDLSDQDVEAAGEYMLSETFPDLPRD